MVIIHTWHKTRSGRQGSVESKPTSYQLREGFMGLPPLSSVENSDGPLPCTLLCPLTFWEHLYPHPGPLLLILRP